MPPPADPDADPDAEPGSPGPVPPERPYLAPVTAPDSAPATAPALQRRSLIAGVTIAAAVVALVLGGAYVVISGQSPTRDSGPYRPGTPAPGMRSEERRPQTDARLPLTGQAAVDGIAVNYTTVVESRDRYDRGVSVVATFTNTSELVLDGYVRISLLDSDDNMLGDDLVGLVNLAPGAATAELSRLTYEDVPDDGVRLAVEASLRVGQAEAGAVDVSQVAVAPAPSLSIPSDPQVRLTGPVRSTLTAPARFPVVTVAYLDADGQLVAAAQAAIEKLAPGTTAEIDELAPVIGPYRDGLTPTLYVRYVHGR